MQMIRQVFNPPISLGPALFVLLYLSEMKQVRFPQKLSASGALRLVPFIVCARLVVPNPFVCRLWGSRRRRNGPSVDESIPGFIRLIIPDHGS